MKTTTLIFAIALAMTASAQKVSHEKVKPWEVNHEHVINHEHVMPWNKEVTVKQEPYRYNFYTNEKGGCIGLPLMARW